MLLNYCYCPYFRTILKYVHHFANIAYIFSILCLFISFFLCFLSIHDYSIPLFWDCCVNILHFQVKKESKLINLDSFNEILIIKLLLICYRFFYTHVFKICNELPHLIRSSDVVSLWCTLLIQRRVLPQGFWFLWSVVMHLTAVTMVSQWPAHSTSTVFTQLPV